MKKCIVLLLFLISSTLKSQVTIAFQGFEGTPADSWNFTPPTQNGAAPSLLVGASNYGAAYAASGSRSMRIGGGSTACGTGSGNCIVGSTSGGSCTNNFNGLSVDFAAINVDCYENVQISIKHRTHVFCTGQGQGLDANENLRFEASINGGPWTQVGNLAGAGNCVWLYTDNPVFCSGAPMANPFVYNVPAGTQTIAFRASININRTDEVMYFDDVTLTGTPITLPPIIIEHLAP